MIRISVFLSLALFSFELLARGYQPPPTLQLSPTDSKKSAMAQIAQPQNPRYKFIDSKNKDFSSSAIPKNPLNSNDFLRRKKKPKAVIPEKAEQLQKGNPRVAIFTPRPYTPNRLFSAELSKPENFVNSNNLIKKSGSFYQARGEVVHISGKVTDSFGVPISGAVIEVWQTNSAGKYQSLLESDSEFMDVHFNMSGKAITDNLGNYQFLTVMPGSYLNRAPHINANIYHEQFGKIETEIYFENHPRNKVDHEYLSYNEEEKELLTAKVKLSDMFNKKSYKICTFNIVMNGVHKYKSFGGEV